jgi:D-serine deaminase-like pyridoxal phosphate-dependent protein
MMGITEPTLLLDTRKCKANIRAMVAKARRNGARLRPHFKTHQSHQIGRWFREEGIDAITVSSLRMASYFAQDGWKDITVAFPVNLPEIDTIKRLAKDITLNLTTLDADTTRRLGEQVESDVHLFIKVDLGNRRTGIPPSDTAAIDAVLAAIDVYPLLHFKGFLSHAGHSYQARSKEEVMAIHTASVAALLPLRARYGARYPNMMLAPGDTPTCSVAEDFSQMDEMRPGNFVFHDLMQCQIWGCEKERIAAVMACPVVAKHADRHEIILYGGGVHFSKDFLELEGLGRSHGELVRLERDGWRSHTPECHLTKLSQEHGTLRVDAETFQRIQIGDVLGILPVHSCMTAHAMRGYLSVEGETIDHMNGERSSIASIRHQ